MSDVVWIVLIIVIGALLGEVIWIAGTYHQGKGD
jgi:hypothetical protein